MFIKLEDAIQIVMELAEQNVIEDYYAREDEGMAALRAEQLEALSVVQDFFVNNVFDGTEGEDCQWVTCGCNSFDACGSCGGAGGRFVPI